MIGNETSDYLMLFPYIMSDTAGGDLTYEKYSFGGGYTRGNSRIRWGASLQYTAQQEYRKVDPRPRNITSDLNIEASMAFRLPGKHFLGFGIEGGLYNQSNQVVLYNPLGGPPSYNMTGVEAYLSRFSLDNSSIDYAGGHYGFSLSLSPEKRQGWHSTFSYRHQLLTRISNGGSANVELDLNTLDYDIFSWKTAYWNPEHHRLPWGISLHLDYEHRYGKDIIYGPSQSDIYPELMRVTWISTTEKPACKRICFGSKRTETFSCSLLPPMNTSPTGISPRRKALRERASASGLSSGKSGR